MLDGLDGLVGGISLTAFSAFAFLSFISDRPVLMLLSISICWSLLAFLIYNWHPAKLFLGDAVSIFPSFAAGYISIALTQGENGLSLLSHRCWSWQCRLLILSLS